MIVLCNYSDPRMLKAQRKCTESAYKHGVDKVFEYGPGDLGIDFVNLNREILSAERGAGFWLWKPYIIRKVIEELSEGDILIYCDSGIEWVNSCKHIIDRMDQDIFFFTNTHPNHHWTKKETLEAMGVDMKIDKDMPWPQVQASVIFIRVNAKTRDFIKRWLLWCQMPGLIDDTKGEQMPYFQEHRHDQSILSILAYDYGYRLHWWPTAYAEHIRIAGDNYPVLFNHHRKRDNEW